MARAISFEYLNRQLVWHELSEVLLFILPLVSVTRIKKMITNKWPSLRAATGNDRCQFALSVYMSIWSSFNMRTVHCPGLAALVQNGMGAVTLKLPQYATSRCAACA